eukprot:2806504-Amphidinium_carterae.1
MDDNEYYDKRRQEEIDRPEQIYWEGQALEGHQHEMEEAYRWETARDRQERRRWERLERRRYPAPKAPPQGITQPYNFKPLMTMRIPEIRYWMKREDERQQRQQGGAYVTPASPNTPTIQQYQDRLDILEDQVQQDEDRRDRLRTMENIVRGQDEEHRRAVQEVRRVEAVAEKEHQDRRAREQEERRVREQEELERQAAIAQVPEEQVAQQDIPRIGENGAQDVQIVGSTSTVNSSSTGASTRMERQERQDSADYWENIMDIMYEYFHDENDIGEAVSLHEGVLYWRTLEDIKTLEQRAYSNDDPEAAQEYRWYLDANEKLDKDLREEYERNHGKLKDREDYQQTLQDKDRDALRNIIFENAAQ